MTTLIENYTQAIKHLSVIEQLKYLANVSPNKIKLSTSFGMEDQLITHFICSENLPIEIFTLDTGRMFAETYTTWNATMQRYKKNIKAFFPPSNQIEKMLLEVGPNSFYESVEKRKQCCHIRKIMPLQRALEGTKIWITGLRQEQSANRQAVKLLECDKYYNLLKLQPLWNWSLGDVEQAAKLYDIVLHPLHAKGFPSIGCAPCTRAVKEGENQRAGRWWWEADNKECGLHVSN